MTIDRALNLPTRGIEAIQRLGDTAADEFPPQVRALLERIRDDLGAPSVNLIFRVLAHEPEVLGAFWDAESSIVRSGEFRSAVIRLQDVTLPTPSTQPPVPHQVGEQLASLVPRAQAIVPRLHLVMAGLAVAAAAWGFGDEDPDDGRVRGASDPRRTPPVPVQPLPDGTLLDRATSMLGHPVPASFLRALAEGEDAMLPVVWPWLGAWMVTSACDAGRRRLVLAATAEAAGLGLGRASAALQEVRLQHLSQGELAAVIDVFLYGYAPDVAMMAAALSLLAA